VTREIKGPKLILVQTPKETCSIMAIRRKTGFNPIHNQLWLKFAVCNNSSGTHRVEDVVKMTPHATGVLIAIV
jgi:hypothetical protein